MTTLSLTVLSHPEVGSAGQRLVQSGELTVGRGSECDWPLPDPMKSLSRKHCRLVSSAGAWQVQDLSTNGTYVNGAPEPIGRDLAQRLADGDRLRLGDYEIEVRILEDHMRPSAVPAVPASGGFAPSPFSDTRLPGLDDPVDVGPWSGIDHAAGRGGSFADHSAASADAFVPPPAVPQGKPVVPDDWFNEIAGAGPKPGAPASQPIPADFDPFSAEPQAAGVSAPADPEPRPVPVPSPAPTEAAMPLRVPVPRPAASPAALPPGGADAMSALTSLLAGANLPPEVAARAAEDPEAALRNAGALLRASVNGIRALLIARGMVKREFRIEQTMLHTKENNPLKFAASDEQALAALLDPRMSSLKAMQESIQDLTSHQVAVLAATQTAARALLERLGPAELEAEDTGSRLLPNALEKRLWEAYKRRHAKLLEQFEDDFESAFGKAFARAYEQAVDKGKG